MPQIIELKNTNAKAPPPVRQSNQGHQGEDALTEEEPTRGGPLVEALTQTARERGQTLADLAEALEVTYGYLVQLRSGSRSSANISDTFASRCARYLGRPRLTVLMLAGRVTSADFFDDDALNMVNLERAYDHIRSDPYWGPRAPKLAKDEASRHPELLLLAVWLYEELKGMSLLPGLGNPKDLADAIDAFRSATKQKLPR